LQEPLKALAHLLMREELALRQPSFAAVHRFHEGAFLVDIPRHDLLR
jgi:hypothetical protein